MDKITLINGNGKPYTKDLPKLVMLTKFINDVALQHIEDNTGLRFVKTTWAYEAQPTESYQIAALFMTYNFKTRMYDNGSISNSLYLKSDHHVGFDVDSICLDCCRHNHIHTSGLSETVRLSC